MNFFKQPIFLGILAVALVITIIWSFIANKNSASSTTTQQTTTGSTVQATTSDLTNATPSDFDNTVKDEVTAATKFALEFNPEFKLSVIEVVIGSNLQQSSIVTRYAFSTTKDVRNNWVYTTNQSDGSFIRALIPKADYLGDIVPINASLWKYNYISALQQAEKSGGSDWRSKNTLLDVTLTLKESADLKKLYWTISYRSADSTDTIVIDATTLEVSQQ
ncbi:MAG: hypothetical protein WCI57_02005 [Candidatus Berkelbacteria bacterium]